MKIKHYIKKPSKKDYYAVVENLEPGQPLSAEDIQTLKLYLVPPIPRKALNSMQWLAKACASQDEVREYLRYIYVTKGKAYATDGHRMHYCDSNLEEGYYCPKTHLKVDFNKSYVNVETFIETFVLKDKSTQTYQYDDFECVISENIKMIKIIIEDVPFNKSLLIEASNSTESIQLRVRGARTAAYGISEFGEFVVMPLLP